MSILNRNHFTYLLLLITGIFFIYMGFVITYQDQIINLMRDLFSYRYNFGSKAFAGFTIFPFIISAGIVTALWTHYNGKIFGFEFAPMHLKIQARKLITIDKLAVQKIIIMQKEENAVEIEIKTNKNSYSIYHFDDTFLNMIKAYFLLQKESKNKKNYKAKTEVKIFEVNTSKC